jgi:hypothetical protein
VVAGKIKSFQFKTALNGWWLWCPWQGKQVDVCAYKHLKRRFELLLSVWINPHRLVVQLIWLNWSYKQAARLLQFARQQNLYRNVIGTVYGGVQVSVLHTSAAAVSTTET